MSNYHIGESLEVSGHQFSGTGVWLYSMHKIWVCSLCDHAAIYECIFLDPFNHNWQSVKLDKNEGFRKMLVFEKQKKTSFRLIATDFINITLYFTSASSFWLERIRLFTIHPPHPLGECLKVASDITQQHC